MERLTLIIPLLFSIAAIIGLASMLVEGHTVDEFAKAMRWYWRILRSFNHRLWRWLLVVFLVLGVPSLPIIIEELERNEVARETYAITAAVFSATFFPVAQQNFLRFWYGVFFAVNLLFGLLPLSPFFNGMGSQYAWALYAAVCVLHAAERFTWHVVLDKPFPEVDRRKEDD